MVEVYRCPSTVRELVVVTARLTHTRILIDSIYEVGSVGDGATPYPCKVKM